MARIDPEKNQIVVRLVYDGPAFAGKTTSLRALARSLGCPMFSGDESDGRTLHFDWVDYVGGRFEGMPICCQIVGVPGQRVLERRRRKLLADADAVVFVADSRPERSGENIDSFRLLREVLGHQEIPVGVVVQANKRDLPGAVGLDALRDSLGGPLLAMTVAVAERGEGVRETFVLAVRLALDRVRTEWRAGRLDRGRPAVTNGQALLAALLGDETSAPSATENGAGSATAAFPTPAPPATSTTGAIVVPPRPTSSKRPQLLPDAMVEPGLVWPPVNGRVLVHEATRDPVEVGRAANGDWIGRSASGEWTWCSPLTAMYFNLEEGRLALVDWARWHTAAGRRLSPDRAVVLAAAAPGAWRLWQIVRTGRVASELWHELLEQSDDVIGEGLLKLFDLRLRAERGLVGEGWLTRVDLGELAAASNGDPVFLGLAPFPPPAGEADGRIARDEESLVRQELAPALGRELALDPRRLPAVLAGVDRAATTRGRQRVAQLVREALLGR